jgi:hypothetical protein
MSKLLERLEFCVRPGAIFCSLEFAVEGGVVDVERFMKSQIDAGMVLNTRGTYERATSAREWGYPEKAAKRDELPIFTV